MPKIIAAFDFDGTITKCDTLWRFLIFSNGYFRFILGLLANLPLLSIAFLGFYPRSIAKERLYCWFFKGVPVSSFLKQCSDFGAGHSEYLKQSAIEKIKTHKQQGHTIVIITASPIEWVEPFAKQLGISILLGTSIQVDSHGFLTGHFATPNCYGLEKVKALLSVYPERSTYKLYAYGDSRGDKELLEFSDFPNFRTLK